MSQAGRASVAWSWRPRVEDGARAGGALGVGQARRIGDAGVDCRSRRERRKRPGVGQARVRRAQAPALRPSGSLIGAERIAGAVDVEGDVAAEAVGALGPPRRTFRAMACRTFQRAAEGCAARRFAIACWIGARDTLIWAARSLKKA